MNITKAIKCMILVLTTSLLLTACSKDGESPEDKQQNEQNKTIAWEVFHEFEPGETVSNFAISDDAKWLFYTNGFREIYRIDLATGSRTALFNQPTGFSYVHIVNGKLYLLYEKDYKSYFAVSDDFGETITEYQVGTYTNYAAGWYDGTFMNVIVNRMFVMPNGDLILPHIME